VITPLQHPINIKRLLSAIFAVLFALGQAEAAFTLNTSCEVSGDGVYLSDLVDSKAGEAVPAILVDVSPSWGTVRKYSANELIKLINEKAQGVEVIASEPDQQTTLRRKSRSMDSSQILELLKTELLKSPLFDEGELEMELIRPWKPMLVPDGALEMRMLTKINYRTSQTSLRFQLMDGGVPFGVFSAAVKISLWKDAWVATRQITRGTLLPEAKLKKHRHNMITVRQDLWGGNPSDGRFWFQENISPGRLIYDKAVVMKPVVRRGSLAKAIITNGSLLVSINVKVLEDGAPGEVVRVQNVRTRKEIIGEVIDEKTIKITVF
jgi:flagella basal body P-ring formation protein FlgA